MSANDCNASCRHRLPDGRDLAFSDTGPADAADVLLCLPGVLETRQTFEPILQARPAGLRCISVDHCGRGPSDPLPDDRGYSMAGYRADLHDFIARQIPGGARVHLLGTSMGGILAFYLTADLPHRIHSLRLNDIGLALHWSSLMALSRQMHSALKATDSASLARSLQVTPGVLAAVQQPAHFDLPYRHSLRGMVLSDLLADFSGPIRLVCGQSSPICLPAQVQTLRRRGSAVAVLEVAGAAHPVPLTAPVCAFLLEGLPGARTSASAAPTTPLPRPTVWRWLQDKLRRR